MISNLQDGTGGSSALAGSDAGHVCLFLLFSAEMHALLLLPILHVQLWGHRENTPQWAQTLSAGQSSTRSTTASWPTWWQPWTWLPTAWPHQMASGLVPRGPPAPTDFNSQTGSCPCRKGGAASPVSPPSRPNVFPSQMLMWGVLSCRDDHFTWFSILWMRSLNC